MRLCFLNNNRQNLFWPLFLLVFLLLVNVQTAQACCSCGTVQGYHQSTRATVNAHMTSEFERLRRFWQTTMLNDHIYPTLKPMWDQIVSLPFVHAESIGMFFDARIQQDTQQDLQRLMAQANKDYMPSEAICKYGTMLRSLAATEEKSKRVPLAMAKRSRDRQTKLVNHAGSHGPDLDFETRRNQFQTTYCDPNSDNNELKELCAASKDKKRWNRDINYTKTVDEPLTLELDFTKQDLTNTEEDVIALGKNLYANEIFKGPGSTILQNANIDRNLLDLRAVIAKRSVAEHSYNSILALKAEGTENSYSMDYLKELMLELGMKESEIDYYLGAKKTNGKPSYYAQMEILTRKIHQDPAFITNLYDTPTNVERQQAIMKSFELMQQRDLFDSLARSEMLLSVLLEMKIMEHQSEVQNRIGQAVATPRN